MQILNDPLFETSEKNRIFLHFFAFFFTTDYQTFTSLFWHLFAFLIFLS